MQRKWRRDWERCKATRNPLKILARNILPPMAAAGILLGGMGGVYANPTDGQITSGAGTIAESGNTMIITQTSDKLGINWQSFNIGTGEKVQFIQPGSSSVALNRVLGNNVSSIYGQLSANGQVFLINPNGVLFAPGAQVNVGGVVASTLNITDSDFMAGNYKFSGEGGSVVNQGTITATNGGYVALLAPEVKNEGIIVAQQGTVALGAGKAVTLDMEGDGLLNLIVDEAAVNASATNHQLIQANGGQVIMAARTANALVDTVVNNTGLIEANSVINVNGIIRLDGNGAVLSSGTLNASGKNAGETGGTVTVLGNTVTLSDGAGVDVSGASSGGTLTVKAAGDINVDAAVTTGNGNVTLRADSDADSSGTVTFDTANGKVVTDGAVSIYYNPSEATTTTINGVETSVKNYATPTDYTANVQNTSGGAGNLTAYMLVNNLNELQAMNLNLSGTYALGTDINAGATSGWNSGAGFASIGSFSGTFDGDGHVISGLTINSSASDAYVGLFGINNGTIRNVGLKNVNIIGDVNSYIGALTGSNNGSISNCYSTGTVTSNRGWYTGGLVGWNSSWGTVTNSYSAAAVAFVNTVGSVASGSSVGGLIGRNYDGAITGSYSTGAVAVISNNDSALSLSASGLVGNNTGRVADSYSTGAVTVGTAAANTGNWNAGGLVGINEGTGSILNSYATGDVSATNGTYSKNYVGGLVGRNVSTNTNPIMNAYSTGAVTVSGNNNYVGGFVGVNTKAINNAYSTGKVTVSGTGTGNLVGGFVGRNSGILTNTYWDITTSGQTAGRGGTSGPSPTAGLSGTAPFAQSSYAGFDFTSANPAWYMVNSSTRPFLNWEYSTTITNAHQVQLMVRDLNATYTLASNIDLSGMNMAAGGWLPVGSDTLAFTGTLEGNGYTILGLTSNNPVTSSNPAFGAAGLFGYTGATAQISNVNLAEVNITGGTNNTYVGALVGYNNGGRITNISSSGTVSGGDHTGGLVGYNAGTLETSYSVSNVSGANNAGGLVGTNAGTGHISDSYYVNGAVSGGSKAGGIAGANSGDITRVYSNGLVSGGSAGGLVGDNSGTVSNAVWDQEKSGLANGVGSGTAAGMGLNTAQMNDPGNYTSWDFLGTWEMRGARPALQWQPDSTVIFTLGQLLSITDDLSGKYVLGDNLSLTSVTWVPVGSDTLAFTGTFDGNGYTLSGLTITNPVSSYVGLFGYTQGATINSVNLANVNIVAGAGNLYAGSLIGYSGSGTTIVKCTSTGTVTANGTNSYVGGLVGYNAGTVLNSSSSVTATANGANSYVGGLAGINAAGGSITGSSNAGTVTGSADGSFVGGLAGQNDGSVADSVNTGAVITTVSATNNRVGGLVGQNNSTVTGSSSSGAVTANGSGSSVGGLVGQNDNTVTGSSSIGMVTANGDGSNVGGLVGVNNGTITGSYHQTGTVTANGTANGTGSSVGGLVGYNTGSITGSSYNTAAVTANDAYSFVGGLVGINDSTVDDSIKNTYNTGVVTSTADSNTIGGLVGENVRGVVTQSYNTGMVTATASATNNRVGGLMGKNSGTVTSSYNAAVVTAQGGTSTIGGLVGENDGSVTGAYSIGLITGTGDGSIVGGLVGQNDGRISYAYSVGVATGTGADSTVGALAGANNGRVANAYWYRTASDQSSGVGFGSTDGILGLTRTQMMQSGNYTGWDTGTWGIVDGISFPYLQWQFSGRTPQFIWGTVQGGHAGQTINVVNAGNIVAQSTTLTDDGLYYTIMPSTLSSASSHKVLLLYVAGDSGYKGTSVYRYGSNGLISGDLLQNTLTINGGSTTLNVSDLTTAQGSLTSPDILYRMANNWLTVDGSMQATNFSIGELGRSTGSKNSLSATGSIIIQNDGDFVINSEPFLYLMNNQQISAGGDITITTGGNFILRHGNPDKETATGRSAYTQLIAGGNITINAQGGFVNTSGPEAIQLTGNGRWLIYAPNQLVYASNRALFYDASLYANGINGNDQSPNANFFYMTGRGIVNRAELTPHSDEIGYDVTGGLTGDFVAWSGEIVPATGSGFIFMEANPAIRPLTPIQIQRREAITAAQSGNEQTGNEQRLEPLTSPTEIPDENPDTLPFLTIIDDGVAI